MRTYLRAIILLTAFTSLPAFAANLDLTPLQRSLQFNFGNPGARSLGMGGAFIGRADDASAAEANPSGLTVISKPEFTLELRQLDYGQDVPIGVPGFSAGTQTVNNRRTVPSFLSYARPLGPIAFAVYYSRPLDYQQHADLADASGVVISNTFFGNYPGRYSVHYRADVFGLAGAWKTGGLSLGIGARYTQVKPASMFALYPVKVVGPLPTKNGNSPDTFGAISGNDSKLSYSAGLKWANPSENLSFGFVYKTGADYSVHECATTAASPASCSGTAPASSFEIPTQYGAGISFRPKAGVTINGDVVRVGYDRLLRHFQSSAFCLSGDCTSTASDLGFKIANVTELHVGAEWAFPGTRIPLALRAGWWHDPAHGLEYRGSTSSTASLIKLAQLASAQLQQPESAQNHISVGLGYITPSFEINGAYDHASRAKTASISALMRF